MKLKAVAQYMIILVFILFLQLSNAGAESINQDDAVQSNADHVAAEPSRAIASSRDNDDDDEYNFSWLDPDKKVYVLQNRKYRKTGKVAAFLSGGINLSNAYKSQTLGIPRLGYWFSEQMGIEVFYAFAGNSDTYNYSSLKSASTSALPFIRVTKSYLGGVFSWVPWYAKLNFFNKILYLDWAVNAGMGQVTTQFDNDGTVVASKTPAHSEENLTAFYVGTSQNFFITQNWSARLDIIGMLYSAKGADGVSTKLYKNFDFTAGVGYLF